MILYHGSNCPVEKPMILITDYTKDFSWGFYTTENFEQAESWAKRRALKDGGTPTVSKYEFRSRDGLSIASFDATDDAWLDFIVMCRTTKEKVPHQYDIVSGPMADDKIWNELSRFLRGELSRENFMHLCQFTHPTQQTSFHTANALLTLRYIGSKEV